jgi:hypothetical protein
MRQHLAALATAAALGFLLLPVPAANAMPAGAASGIRQGLADTNMIEQVVRICHRNVRTGERRCWIDRSRPPTVCHVIRERDGTRRLDCY